MSEQININKIPLHENFQLSLLRLFFEDDAVFYNVFKTVGTENIFEFEDYYVFYKWLCDYYKQKDKLPSKDVINNEIKKLPEELQTKFTALFETILQADISDRDYITDELEPYIKQVNFIRTFDTIHDKFNNNPNEAYKEIQNLSSNLESINFQEDEYFLLTNMLNILDNPDDNMGRRIKTGLKAFDNNMNGGVGAGEVCTFLARDGVGKSMVLMNVGALAVEEGKKVLHIHCEGQKKQPVIRYTARLNNLITRNLKNSAITADERLKVEETAKKHSENLFDEDTKGLGKLYIKPFLSADSKSDHSATIEDLISYCKKIYKKFKFDVVIVDYGDKLGTNKKVEAVRFISEKVWSGLEKIAFDYNVPVFTASQSVRITSKKTRVLRKEDIAESMFKSRISSYIISINREEDDIKKNTIRFYLNKNREDETNKTIICPSDFDRARAYTEDNQREKDEEYNEGE